MERSLNRFGILALHTLVWTLPLGLAVAVVFGDVRVTAPGLLSVLSGFETPLGAWHPFLSPFERPSISQRFYFQVAVSTVALLYFGGCASAKLLRVPRSVVLAAAILFGIVAVASSLVARSTLHTLRELAFLGCGILLLGMVVHLHLSRRQSRRLLISLVGVAAVCGLLGLLQYRGVNLQVGDIGFSQNVNGGRFGVRSLLGHPNYLAVFVGSVFFLCPGLIAGSTHRVVRGVLAAAMAVLGICIIVTGSRSIWLATLVVGAALAWLSMPALRGIRLNRPAKVGIGVVAVLVALVLIPNPLVPRRYSFTGRLLSTRPVEGRMYFYVTAARMIAKNPILGVGYNNYGLEFWDHVAEIQTKPENRVFSYILEDMGGIRADQAHNEYLQMAAEMGVLGLGTFLFFVVVLFWQLRERYGKLKRIDDKLILAGMGSAVAVILIDSLFSFPLRLPWSSMVFWLIVGVGSRYASLVVMAAPQIRAEAAAVEPEPSEEPPKGPSRRRRRKRARSH